MLLYTPLQMSSLRLRAVRPPARSHTAGMAGLGFESSPNSRVHTDSGISQSALSSHPWGVADDDPEGI